MIVEYCKANSKRVFGSSLLSTIDQAFEKFSGAVFFSVFDLNSDITKFLFRLEVRVLPPFAPLLDFLSLTSFPWASICEATA